MRLATGTLLLRRSLAILGAIAAEAHGKGKGRVLGRVHAQWHMLDTSPAVTLTAIDGHRSCSITLRGDASGNTSAGEAAFALSGDPFLNDEQLHTIFRASNGEVKLIGERTEPVGIARTRVEQAAFGLNLGKSDEPYPIEVLAEVKEAAKVGFATDFNNRGIRKMEINPEYMADGLAIINGFWGRVAPDLLPRVDMAIPPHPNAPIVFTSEYPEKAPLFRIEYIIMPYGENS
jgi:hypothetical protein